MTTNKNRPTIFGEIAAEYEIIEKYSELVLIRRGTFSEYEPIKSSSNIFTTLYPYFALKMTIQEQFFLICLDLSNNIIGISKLSEGGMNSTLIDVRLLLAISLLSGASNIIIAHNHPSGNLKPSYEDRKITDKIKQAASLLDIKLLDHLILAEHNYYSFADNDLLNII